MAIFTSGITIFTMMFPWNPIGNHDITIFFIWLPWIEVRRYGHHWCLWTHQQVEVPWCFLKGRLGDDCYIMVMYAYLHMYTYVYIYNYILMYIILHIYIYIYHGFRKFGGFLFRRPNPGEAPWRLYTYYGHKRGIDSQNGSRNRQIVAVRT